MAGTPSGLAILDRANQLLAQATSLDDVKQVRDTAESARIYAKAAKLGLELQNKAAEIKLRAERKAGAYLAALHLKGGDRRSKRQHASLKLETLGLTKDQSKRWQVISKVPDAVFEKYLQDLNSLGKEVTAVGLLRLAANGRPVPNRPRPSQARILPAARPVNVDKAAILAILDEVSQHGSLLASLLEPLCNGQPDSLSPASRRHITRLVKEIGQSISELRRLLWSEP